MTEVKPNDPPAGWSFSDPVYDPADGKVKVTEKNQTVSVTVTNEILKPGINIVKTASATQVNPGQTVTYTYTVTNPGDTPLTDVKVDRRQVRTGCLQVRRHRRRHQAAAHRNLDLHLQPADLRGDDQRRNRDR
ncbi:MAG: hypothetical protein V9G09_12025 [Candidatus Nanopelagicales bacterium]